MDSLEIRKEIAALIDRIKVQSDSIDNQKHIHQSELDMLLTTIKKLYEKCVIYDYLNVAPDTILKDNSIEVPINTDEQEVIAEKIAETQKAEVPIISETLDLFGAELQAISEKQKSEKKRETKEENQINKIQKPAITDITQVIGINDKFQFANELFAGNMTEYTIAIQQLNAAGTLESAMDYFGNLQQLYEWDPTNETLKRLLDLVDRRYTSL